MAKKLSGAALAVLVGKELWPCIQAVVHWNDQAGKRGLSRLYIHYSDDQASAQSAHRLSDWVAKSFESIDVHLPAQPLGSSASDLLQQIRAWRDEAAAKSFVVCAATRDSQQIIGLVDSLLTDSDSDYFHYCGDGRWECLTSKDDAVIPEPIAMDSQAVTDLSAESLAAGLGTQTQPVDAKIDVPELLNNAAENEWDLRAAFEEGGKGADASESALFAELIGAGLTQMGVANLVRVSTTDSDVLAGIDVLGILNGRVVLIDCKLNYAGQHDESLTSQIVRLGTLAQSVGGNTLAVLFRPTRRAGDAVNALAEAHGVHLLDEHCLDKPFQRLAKILDVAEVPEPLTESDEIIGESHRPFRALRTPEEAALDQPDDLVIFPVEPVVSIPALFQLQAARHELPWMAAESPDGVYFRAYIEKELDTHFVKRSIYQMFSDYSEIQWIKRSKSGQTVDFKVRPISTKRGKLKKLLKARFDKPLLDED